MFHFSFSPSEINTALIFSLPNIHVAMRRWRRRHMTPVNVRPRPIEIVLAKARLQQE